MKIGTNTAYLAELMTGNRRWIIGHLYTFTSFSGATDYFTDLDIDVIVGGITYKSSGLRIEGLLLKLGIGISVDEQNVVIWASPTDTLFGAACLTGLAEGLMDGGTIARDRAVWVDQTGDAAEDVRQPPIAVWRMFLGYMSTIENVGRASVTFKVKSPLVKLNIQMPRNFYQPGCLWSLFDSGCTLNRAAFAVNGTVLNTGITNVAIPVVGGVVNPTGSDGLPNYQRGRLIFTSGINNGLEVTIDNNNAIDLFLAYQLNALPHGGDTFTYYPGCSKSFSTCVNKFNNGNNFRGFDKVPPVFVAL